MEFFILLWLWLPTYFRMSIILVLLALLMRKAIVKYLPTLIRLITWLILQVLKLVALVIIFVLGRVIIKQRKHGKSYFLWVHAIENAIEKALVTVKELSVQVSQGFSNKRLTIQRYNRLLGGLTAVLFFIIYLWPTSPVGKQWIKMDKWFVNEVLAKDYLTPDQAEEQLIAIFEDSRDSKSGPRLKLKSKFHNGAYVRESPSLNSDPVAELKEDETVEYLGEEDTDINGRKWYKIETDKGVVGWVSEKVVEMEN
jgi:hypothetical protein